MKTKREKQHSAELMFKAKTPPEAKRCPVLKTKRQKTQEAAPEAQR